MTAIRIVINAAVDADRCLPGAAALDRRPMPKLTQEESENDSHEARHHSRWNPRSLRFQALVFIAALVGLAIGVSPRAAAQSYAAVHGTVTDATGAVISNPTASILNNSTGIKTTVQGDSKGYYIFPQLQIGGPYTVTIAATGFENFISTGLKLAADDNREISAKLQIGHSTQTIEVSTAALQVETSNTQLQQIATADEIEEMPLEGRDAGGLQKLQTGVVESSDRFGNFSSNGSQTPQNDYLISGSDISDFALQQKGFVVNPDALQEQDIVTSTINPEYARNSGAVINQVIKSGTNSIHGSGFEFYRDTFLNNGNYFSQTRPVFHQNVYGGTLGGPIIKNKLFLFAAYQGLRNRTASTTLQQTLDSNQFGGIFSGNANYHNQFSPDGAPSTQNVNGTPQTFQNSLSVNPMPFAYQGCAAGTLWAACPYFNNGTGGGNSTINVPTNTWNPIASALIKQFVPQSNEQIGGTSYYNFNALQTQASDQGILRADYTPTSKDAIWASSVFQSNPQFNTLTFGGGSFPGFASVQSNHIKFFNASYTHTFSANKLNELRGGYYRDNFPTVIPATNNSPSSLGFDISPQLPQSGVPYISVGDYFNLGFSFEGPQPRTDSNLTYADNFTWVRGSHTLKFGFSYEQFRVHNPFALYNNGLYGFAGGTGGGGDFSSGDPLLDFVLGVPDTYAQTTGGFLDVVAGESYAFAQDNWKVSPDFTFNYGLSWDIEQPSQNGQFGGLGITCWSNSSATSTVFPGGPPGLAFNGDPGCNRAGGPTTHFDHFAPRIGFAWSPSNGPAKLIGQPGNHELSVRAGFGVYYNRDQEEQSLQNLGDPPSFLESHGINDQGGQYSPSFANPFADIATNTTEANPFPHAAPAAGAAVNWAPYNELGLAEFSPTYNVPYTYNYNLNIQRALTSNLIAQVSYVGSVSHRLSTWFEGDNITPAGHTACLANPACANNPGAIALNFPQYLAQPALSPNGTPWYTTIGDQNTEGHSNYNSFQVSLTQAQSHGLYFTLGYTYSHALDDGSGYESVTGSANRVYNFVPGFQNLNYGSSDFDARHRLTAGYVYTVPVAGFMKSNAILRETLSGWGIGGITALQTGFPVGINNGIQSSVYCEGSYFGCPDVPETSNFNIAKMNIRSATHQEFATASFSPETLGTFGNTPRNFFHGPGFDYTNLRLSKNIHFYPDSKQYMQLRLEASNLFNHANFAPPGGSLANAGTFGIVTAVDGNGASADPNGDPSPGRAIQLAGKIYF